MRPSSGRSGDTMRRRGAVIGAIATLALGGTVDSLAAQGSADRARSARQPAVARAGHIPIVKQAFHNNCETAALSMMLAAAGRPVDQRVLQQALPRSGPLDPITRTDDGVWIWGDPDQGFVGRVAGGGVAGGFGVYQGPIRRLAARYGVRLENLTRRPAADIFARLRSGRPVIAWIGLSEGPYVRWRTPSAKLIGVNFGEHTVLLTGLNGDSVLVNDPLTGTRATWTMTQFEEKWRLLGERALGQ